MRAYIFWFVGGAVVCALVLRGFRAKWRMQQRLRHYQASSTAATVAAEGENGQRCDGSHFSMDGGPPGVQCLSYQNVRRSS